MTPDDRDDAGRREAAKALRWQMAGWLLFIVCALLFIAAGWVQRDPLTLAGSVVFLAACFCFAIPLAAELRRWR